MSFLFGTNSNTDENEQLKNELQRLGNTIQKLMDEKNTLKQENNNLKINYDDDDDEHVFLGTLLHTREDSVKIYVSSCRKLIPNVLPWQYNRKLDEAHVIHLQDIILMKKSLEGNIDILECNEELCVVNGQHRVQALQEIMRNDESFTMELIVNVHPVPSFDSPEANDIFTATNNSKNVEMKETIIRKIFPKLALATATQARSRGVLWFCLVFAIIATYFASLSSMPSVGIDAFGTIFVSFSSFMELYDSGAQNFRHVNIIIS